MRITRLYLRNYRVFEQELDLTMPAGLVGIYGPNGAGKSSLIESILFTLWGRSRTRNEEIRTTGVNAECITELEFEHEGHLYEVRRTISGINSTMKAEVSADRQQVASGVQDVKRYIHSVLGMDDSAFRASVFAEQKQVAAFSLKRPAERRDLVLRLLGITPLDQARDAARTDAKAARDDVERVRGLLLNVDELRPRVEQAKAAAELAVAESESEATAAATAKEKATAAELAYLSLDEVRQEHDALVRDGKAARAEVDDAAKRVEETTKELAGLAEAEGELEQLQPLASCADDLQRELSLAREVATATAAVRSIEDRDEPPRPDDDALAAALAAAATCKAELDSMTGEQRAAVAELERAKQQLDKSASLSREQDCPVCGQELGDAFASVQEHRKQEVAEADARVKALAKRHTALLSAATEAAASLEARQDEHRLAAEARILYEQALARRAAAQAALSSAVEALGRELVPEEMDKLEVEAARARDAARRCDRLEGLLARKPVAQLQLAEARDRHAQAEGRRAALLEKVKALKFDASKLEALKTERDAARARAEAAASASEAARIRAERASVEAEGEARRLADAEAQHANLAEQSERSRHLGRLADLLNAFRTNVVATVGPRLSAQAADLFAELTDHEYDLLRVDPETYEIQIVDAGREFGMERFSGSETDLANLALRVAISEHVRFQSGGAVGLLVLDEVFGPLDDERRERMLLALERLRARFGQVLVVTHANEIKAQLPSAIEVVKLPGRRATAHVIGA